MKDKSRFMSSVIVSLLAGFIYYLFGQDINENVQSSLKAVLSSNDINESSEQYMLSDCKPFESLVQTSGKKSKQKKSKFYIKKRTTIELKHKGVTVPGEELLSNLISAKFVKPVADKRTDFTAELDQLIKENKTKSKPVELSSLLNKSKNEVAETRKYERKSEKLNKNFEKKQIKTYYFRKSNAEYKGSGFEYNYVTEENAPKSGSPVSEINNTAPVNECKEYKTSYTKTKTVKQKKVKNYAPKVKTYKVKSINVDDNEIQEINAEDFETGKSCN